MFYLKNFLLRFWMWLHVSAVIFYAWSPEFNSQNYTVWTLLVENPKHKASSRSEHCWGCFPKPANKQTCSFVTDSFSMNHCFGKKYIPIKMNTHQENLGAVDFPFYCLLWPFIVNFTWTIVDCDLWNIDLLCNKEIWLCTPWLAFSHSFISPSPHQAFSLWLFAPLLPSLNFFSFTWPLPSWQTQLKFWPSMLTQQNTLPLALLPFHPAGFFI